MNKSNFSIGSWTAVWMLSLCILCTLSLPVMVNAQEVARETAPAGAAQTLTEEAEAPAPPPELTAEQVKEIESFVKGQMERGLIPGMAVVIVMGEHTVYQKGFGFADVETRTPVTPATLFEIGSTSKAFTGLAVLQLEKEGLLSLEEPVSTYLPWLKMNFRGREVSPKVSQFLYQTSGVPFKTIADIPEAEGDDALEKTVRNLVGIELRHEPGTEFLYATINYDVLGLLVQQLSGKSFEEYMAERVLKPLGMNGTTLVPSEARARGLAKGYKVCFGAAARYDAPVYRGNVPAGYVMTNIEDLALWLKVQMGAVIPGNFDTALIEKSHVTDPGLPASNYAVGWMVMKELGQVVHPGGNPNFSSLVTFFPKKQAGVAVLANSSSNMTTGTARGIGDILAGQEPKASYYDQIIVFDRLGTKILMFGGAFLLLGLVLLIRTFFGFWRKKRRFFSPGAVRVVGMVIATIIFAVFVYLMLNLPGLLNYDVPWGFLSVWGPHSFIYAALAVSLAFCSFYLLAMVLLTSRREKEAKK